MKNKHKLWKVIINIHRCRVVINLFFPILSDTPNQDKQDINIQTQEHTCTSEMEFEINSRDGMDRSNLVLYLERAEKIRQINQRSLGGLEYLFLEENDQA